MKKLLIVHAHPRETSFTSQVRQEVIKQAKNLNMEINEIDLYKENFNPVLTAAEMEAWFQGKFQSDVLKYQKLIRESTHMIITYPIWWFERPAIIKGWFDRVFSPGFAYKVTETGPQGLLTHLKTLVFQSVGSPETLYKDTGFEKVIQTPMSFGTLGFTGTQNPQIKSFYGLAVHGAQSAPSYLKEAGNITQKFLNDQNLEIQINS